METRGRGETGIGKMIIHRVSRSLRQGVNVLRPLRLIFFSQENGE